MNYLISMPEEIKEKIKSYIEATCVFEKAELLQDIKNETGLTYFDLELELFETRRTLIRINSMNNLVPCLRDLVKKNIITRIIAYELANKEPSEQYEFYEMIQEVMELNRLIELQVKTHDPTSKKARKRKKIISTQPKLSWEDFSLIKELKGKKEEITETKQL